MFFYLALLATLLVCGNSASTSQYYLMTKVVSGDMSKNGSYSKYLYSPPIPSPQFPILPLTHSPTSPSPSNTPPTPVVPIPINTTTPGLNHAAVLPPNNTLSTNRIPGFLQDFYQQFSAVAATNKTTTIAFVLPGVDIHNLTRFGNVYMNINDPTSAYVWNAGFEFDGERGLVFTYAGKGGLSGWVGEFE